MLQISFYHSSTFIFEYNSNTGVQNTYITFLASIDHIGHNARDTTNSYKNTKYV